MITPWILKGRLSTQAVYPVEFTACRLVCVIQVWAKTAPALTIIPPAAIQNLFMFIVRPPSS